jgi:hypothetical protein
MVSRALILATVTLVVGCFTTGQALAQAQNLEAGKSPSQIFAQTCNACHKSPRGLLKTVPPGSLPAFLRQHYTTSPEMAGVLSSYLVSNGATDTRLGSGGPPPKGGKDGAKDGAAKDAPKDGAREARQDPRPAATPEQLDRFGRRQRPATQEISRPAEGIVEPEPREAAKPDTDGLTPQGEPPAAGRTGHNAKRLARPADAPDAAAGGERGPDGRNLSGKRLSKRGRPGDEPRGGAAGENPSRDEPAGGEPKKDSARIDIGKPEDAKPSDVKPSEAKPSDIKPSGETAAQSAKVEPDRGPALRADPVPPVTPAPASAAPSGGPASASTEPAAGSPVSVPPAPAPAPPPAATASVPPATPAGPPAPPISQ